MKVTASCRVRRSWANPAKDRESHHQEGPRTSAARSSQSRCPRRVLQRFSRFPSGNGRRNESTYFLGRRCPPLISNVCLVSPRGGREAAYAQGSQRKWETDQCRVPTAAEALGPANPRSQRPGASGFRQPFPAERNVATRERGRFPSMDSIARRTASENCLHISYEPAGSKTRRWPAATRRIPG